MSLCCLTSTRPAWDESLTSLLSERWPGECFMPLGYGGGVRTMEHARRLFSEGVEKVVLGSILSENPGVVGEIADAYGAQAVVGGH